MNRVYTIEPVPTSKDEIKHPPLAEEGVIPELNTSTILVGKSGSGKSVLLHNLLMRKEFFNKYQYFDKIFLVSPSAECDDIQRGLNLPPSCVFTDLTEGELALEKIEAYQSGQIKKLGSGKAQKFCIVYDDCIGHTKFMNSPVFISSFIKCRHYNFTVFLCSQHFRKVPKICRMQASYLCFFAISNNEAEMLAEEFSPPSMKKDAFLSMVNDTLKEPYSFLIINMRSPWETRFRKGLAEPINLDAYRGKSVSHTLSQPIQKAHAPQDLSNTLPKNQ